MNSTKKSFIQVWKELTYFLSWFVVGGWLISTLRDDKPWVSLMAILILFFFVEGIYLTGYWVFVGFKNEKDS